MEKMTEFVQLVGGDMRTTNERLVHLETNKEFVLTINEKVASHERMSLEESRRKLYMQGSFGKLHLDFHYIGEDKARSQILFQFPTGTPLANGLIEVQTYDGGVIWVGDNQKIVRGANLTNGARYIVDLIGFWRT